MRSAEPSLPVAYLPGASGRAAVLRPVAERLARRRVPHLLDYPGLSDSPVPADVDSLDDLAHYLVRALPERFDAVALSTTAATIVAADPNYGVDVQHTFKLTVPRAAPAGAVNNTVNFTVTAN